MKTGQIIKKAKRRQEQSKRREQSLFIQRVCNYSSDQYHHLLFEVGMITVDRMLHHFYKGEVPQDIRRMWTQDKAIGYWVFWKNTWYKVQEQFIRVLREGKWLPDEFETWMENIELEYLDKQWNYHLSRN